MKQEKSADQRKARRLLPRLVRWGIIGLVIVGIFVLFQGVLSPAPNRETVVIVDDPIRVVSIDAKRHRVTVADLPQQVMIPAAFGYGKYTMRAIISLDEIDHRDGALIASSVSNALGLPVTGLHAFSAGGGQTTISTIRSIFSFRSLFVPWVDRSRTWIGWMKRMQLVFAIASLSADAVRVVDLAPSIVTTVAPDGGTVDTLDESRVDYLLDDAFFDADIRSENISVAVYNTTAIPAVGQRASRMLARVGMQLVFVGNAEGEIKGCELAGSKEALVSKTALFIARHFGCSTKEEQGGGKDAGADLEVLLGTDFANQYQ